MTNMFKMCLNPKVMAGLAAAAVGVWMLAPQWIAAALPLLFLAICPLSMLLMMKMMMPGSNQQDEAAHAAVPAASDAALQDRLRDLEVQQAAVAAQLQSRRQPQV